MLRKHVLAEQLDEFSELKMGPPLIPSRGDDAMREGDPLPLRVLPLSGGRVHAESCASD